MLSVITNYTHTWHTDKDCVSMVYPHNVMQNIPIPTMDTGAEVAKRFYKELTDIQVHLL